MNQPHLDVDHEHDRIDNALDGTPKDPALSGLQESVRAQIIAIVKGEINSKTMSQLQRFCASVGQALVTLERPDALVRNRFQKAAYPMIGMGMGDYYGDEDSLAPSPANETYGANTSRGLIESAAKIGKDLVTAQAEAQRAARAPSITEMITAFAVAKNAKLPKATLKLMEKQISDAAAASAAPTSVALLPQAIPVPPPNRKRT
jgi:hypothetical protein